MVGPLTLKELSEKCMPVTVISRGQLVFDINAYWK